MNEFHRSKLVEARSLALLAPFLEDLNGRYVLTNKGRLGRFLQETCGDLLFNDKQGRVWGVECKAEEKYTGNVFLETWSNRNLDDPDSHAYRGSNPGWLLKMQADLLFYHFLDGDVLLVFNAFALKRWAFCKESRKRSERASRIAPELLKGRIWDFPERPQSKYDQYNDTHGRLVPIDLLHAELDIAPRRFSVQQLSLQLLAGAA